MSYGADYTTCLQPVGLDLVDRILKGSALHQPYSAIRTAKTVSSSSDLAQGRKALGLDCPQPDLSSKQVIE